MGTPDWETVEGELTAAIASIRAARASVRTVVRRRQDDAARIRAGRTPTARLAAVLAALSRHGTASAAELAAELGEPLSAVRRDLRQGIADGAVQAHGATRARRYWAGGPSPW